MRCGFCSDALGVHSPRPAIYNEVVDAVFDERLLVRRRKEPLGVGFVFGEEEVARAFAMELVLTQPAMARLDCEATACQVGAGTKRRQPIVASPGPRVPEPKCREYVEFRGFWTAIRCGYANKKIVRIHLGVFERNIEVAVLAQDARVPQLEFRSLLWPAVIYRHELLVGKARVRITVEHPHVAVGRRTVGVEIHFLHVLTVGTLRAGHTEQAFLQDWIAAVPERERQTKPLFEIRDAADSILAPTEGARPGVIVRKIIPSIAVCAVILSHGAPGALREIGTPQMPPLVIVILREALLLGVHQGRLAIKNRKSATPN